MSLSAEEIRQFVLEHFPKGGRSFGEMSLWTFSLTAPHGGMVIPPSKVNPYLLRLYLTESRRKLTEEGVDGRFYLHHFFRGDEDRELHNHPWKISYSLILTGGYTEERWDPEQKKIVTREFRPGSINTIGRDDYHKVTLLEPDRGCWTLFFTIGRVAVSDGYDWGFLDTETGKYTPWGEFQQKHT